MSITISDFKEYFNRPFPYLPVWDVLVSYNKDEVVYYGTTRLFYIALSNSIPVGTLPTNATYFSITTEDYYNYINDTDIEKAIAEQEVMIPIARFETPEVLTLAQLFLTAHCLCDDIKTTNAGLASQISFPVASKSAGSISTGFSVPKNFLNKEAYTFYLNSQWGLKYLSLLLPRIKGNMSIAYGWTGA